MPLHISYMGTKRQLAGTVSELVADSRPGAFLDLFAGMCSVATTVQRARQVWTNDVQHFAHSVSNAFLCSRKSAPPQVYIANACLPIFRENLNRLSVQFAGDLDVEIAAIENRSVDKFRDLFDKAFISKKFDNSYKYSLFTDRYAGAYFGLRQCIEIDSIKYSIDRVFENGYIDSEGRDWLVLALCQALSKSTTSTGHFAQPLSPKESNIGKFACQRARSIWAEWVAAMPALIPLGSSIWRKKNVAFRSDALSLVSGEVLNSSPPSVIYADPPYTSDQYSRYYHIYETLILYDHPDAIGRGLYRGGRAVSDFSLKARVDLAMEDLVRCAKGMGADLIISYPTNGLMRESRQRIPDLMRRHYGCAPTVIEVEHVHSTMGASKGVGKAAVTEVLYRVAA